MHMQLSAYFKRYLSISGWLYSLYAKKHMQLSEMQFSDIVCTKMIVNN